MPLLQGRHEGRAAIVTVAIVDAAKYKEHRQSGNPVFQGAAPFRALIDTGATRTMIARRVVAQRELQQVNKIKFPRLEGAAWRAGYLFLLLFICPHLQFMKPSPTEFAC